MAPDKEKKKKVPKEVSQTYLERAAMDYLGKYASSTENLRRVLRRKVMRRCQLREEEPHSYYEMVDTVVAKVVRIGLIDDKIYTEAKVASLRRKGNSSRLIQAKLSAKGLNKDDIGQAVSESEIDEIDAARRLVKRRRLGPYRLQNRREFQDKDIAVLARAGFSFSVAYNVITENSENSGD
ncbi:regulatory protein RecX [Microvirga sp. W0021]|uniref:Regulatory protein RecX n=1 Tax=Hohaiivirga grylli TaxID=3133970 RepID=A0ABV0BFN3_9HYPH